ncbi:carbohydrate kinase family protein [Candidatus Woesearchaeota archaeon]|nr:carbohydrate kinase family protein [Candidatus Woesearchaeota archaeon]
MQGSREQGLLQVETMLDVITVGSATVDIFVKVKRSQQEVRVDGKSRDHHLDVAFHIGGKSLIEELHSYSGGGGTNAAVAFSRLGFKTGWVGKLGDDHQRHGIEHELRKENVSMLCSHAKGNTGLSIILIGLRHDRTVLAYKGVNDQLAWQDIPQNMAARFFYFSSMIGKSLKTIEQLALYAKKRNVPYAFNPSQYLASMGLRKLKKIVEGCSILALNREEAKELLRMQKPIPALLKALQEHAKIAVITDGSNGAYAYDGAYAYSVPGAGVKVVESTGAGDAFASGFAAGMLRRNNIEFAMKLGLVEAGSVLQAIGAKNNLLGWNEAVRKADKVKVKKYII